MTKKFYLPLLISVLLTGCGGGSTTPESSTTITATQTVTTIDPQDINLTQDILDGKISDYDAGAAIEAQYLSIVNYLRSLAIQCNDERAAQGPSTTPLQWNALLENSAKEHSEDMRIAEHYAHEGSGTASDLTAVALGSATGSTPFERMSYNGYDFNTASENIAMKASTSTLDDDMWIEIMEAWIKSETGHCSNIMSSDFIDFGMYESTGTADIEYSDGITRTSSVAYWTQNFGKPQ